MMRLVVAILETGRCTASDILAQAGERKKLMGVKLRKVAGFVSRESPEEVAAFVVRSSTMGGTFGLFGVLALCPAARSN